MEIKYEAVFILKEICETKPIIEEINKVISEQGGNISYKEELGLKKLAYKVKGNDKGHYYVVDFETSEKLKDIIGKISMKINTIEEVIKYIILKKNTEEENIDE